MYKEHFLKKLSESNPKALEQFYYNLLPETFLATEYITITCPKHGDFKIKPHSHLYGTMCKACYSERRSKTTRQFVEQSKSKFGDKFDYTDTHYSDRQHKVVLKCPDHGSFVILPREHFKLNGGCIKCDSESRKLLLKQKWINKAIKRHRNQYDYNRVQYVNSWDKVEIICPKHGSFWQTLFFHASESNGCPSCVRFDDRLILNDFIEKSRKIHGDTYRYNKVIYETNNSMVVITCPKHGDFTQRAGSHLAGNKCRACYIEESWLPTEEFISKAKQIHGNTYDYSKMVYKGSKVPVEILCQKHGSFWVRPNSHVSSKVGCRWCYESKGEAAIKIVLEKYGIDFMREYRIRPYLYRYDFYLPTQGIFIEFHGLQHYRPVEWFGGKDEFKNVRTRDKLKRQIVANEKKQLIVLNHESLKNSTVEKDLVEHLKKAYRYWFVVNGGILALKIPSEVYRAFYIPSTIKVKNLEEYVETHYPTTKCLFKAS